MKEEKYNLREWITVIFWRILKHSFIFRIWYKDFLRVLLLELERFDLEGKEITQKYLEKYNRFK